MAVDDTFQCSRLSKGCAGLRAADCSVDYGSIINQLQIFVCTREQQESSDLYEAGKRFSSEPYGTYTFLVNPAWLTATLWNNQLQLG